MISKRDKVFIAGHKGMVGSAIFRCLKKKKYKKIIVASRSELDLKNYDRVNNFLKKKKPKVVIICAAKVGGIKINNEKPAEFYYENITIQNNLIHASFLNNIKKIVFLGSSCIYPKITSQPISEEQLLTGELETTNEAYAIAKIAGLKMCEFYNKQYEKIHNLDYRSLMPTNLFGYGDNYHPNNSHVVPALIKKVHEAKLFNKNIEIWGSGNAKRDFLFVEDLANVVEKVLRVSKKKFFIKNFDYNHLNVGSSKEISIRDVAKLVCEVIGHNKKLVFNAKMPDGTMKKLLDTRKLNRVIKFKKTDLKKALKLTYLDYLQKN